MWGSKSSPSRKRKLWEIIKYLHIFPQPQDWTIMGAWKSRFQLPLHLCSALSYCAKVANSCSTVHVQLLHSASQVFHCKGRGGIWSIFSQVMLPIMATAVVRWWIYHEVAMTSGLWRKHQLQLRLYSELDKKLKVSSINWFFIFRVFQKTKQTKKQKPPTNQPNKKNPKTNKTKK